MQMEDDLSRPATIVDLQLEILRLVTQFLSHLLDSIGKHAVCLSRSRDEIGVMFLRANQQMHRRFGIDILEDDDFIILVEDIRLGFAIDYFAEDTIIHSAGIISIGVSARKERLEFVTLLHAGVPVQNDRVRIAPTLRQRKKYASPVA